MLYLYTHHKWLLLMTLYITVLYPGYYRRIDQSNLIL